MNFRAAIFDLDGTLLDSMNIWKKIDIDFLAKRGLDVPEDYADAISCLRLEETAQYTIARFGLSETPQQLIDEWEEMACYEYANHVKLFPYANDYLLELKRRGVRLAVATSSTVNIFVPCLKQNEILDLFDVCCCADEVGKGKDSPDLFLYTAQKLGISPKECIVFDDLLPAIQSAKQAGMIAYGIFEPRSAKYETQIRAIADGFLYDFRQGPLPEVQE